MALEANEVVEGRVVNGEVVLDDGSRLPEGARVRLKVVARATEEDEEESELDKLILPDPSLPPGHPLAPYDRETELAILRASIESMKAGEVGIPFRQAMEELSRKHRLPPLPPE
jgi:hypothetical protein